MSDELLILFGKVHKVRLHMPGEQGLACENNASSQLCIKGFDSTDNCRTKFSK